MVKFFQLFVASILIASALSAQTVDTTKFINNLSSISYSGLKGKKAIIVPFDTVNNKIEGSIAYLNGLFYIKNSIAWTLLIAQESDPAFLDHVAASITSTNISNWNRSFDSTSLRADTVSFYDNNGSISHIKLPPAGTVTQLNDSTITVYKMNGEVDTIQFTLPPVAFFDTIPLHNQIIEKQATLVSGTNIKTINGTTLLGPGDLAISTGSGTVTSVATNNGSGITGGTITSTGTLAIDTTIISTKDNVLKLSKDSAAVLRANANTKLPLAGGTMTGNLLFTDNTYDIGASAATRPRSIYAGTLAYLGQTGGLIVGKWPQAANYGFIGSLGLTSTSTNYNVLITANGLMNLNAPTGQTVNIGVNNSMSTSFSSTAITFSLPVTSTQYKLSALNTAPASTTATGTLGEQRDALDGGTYYHYLCVATNTWVRFAYSTW